MNADPDSQFQIDADQDKNAHRRCFYDLMRNTKGATHSVLNNLEEKTHPARRIRASRMTRARPRTHGPQFPRAVEAESHHRILEQEQKLASFRLR